jgi:hypothetical protein
MCGGCRVGGLKLDDAVWIGMTERIDTLVVVSGDKQDCIVRRQQAHEFLVARIKVLEFVNDQMVDLR